MYKVFNGPGSIRRLLSDFAAFVLCAALVLVLTLIFVGIFGP